MSLFWLSLQTENNMIQNDIIVGKNLDLIFFLDIKSPEFFQHCIVQTEQTLTSRTFAIRAEKNTEIDYNCWTKRKD